MSERKGEKWWSEDARLCGRRVGRAGGITWDLTGYGLFLFEK